LIEFALFIVVLGMGRDVADFGDHGGAPFMA